MKPKVYIRADGDAEIGLGHLVRCMALAHMLKSDFDIYFICKEAPQNIVNKIKSNFYLLMIKEEKDILKIIKDNDIVVLDGYDFDSEYQKLIKSVGCKLICIDDMHHTHFFADVVINHAPAASIAQYSAENYTKFYLGLKYALLRDEFLQIANKEKQIFQINNVLICFGGSDSNNITLKVLKAVLKAEKFEKINVIVGESYNHYKELIKFTSDHLNVCCYHAIEAPKMLAIMKSCEFAIVPSSTISLECCFAKMIILTGITSENQQDIHKGLKELPFVKSINDFNNVNIQVLINEIISIKKLFKEFTIPEMGISHGSIVNIFKSLKYDKN
jgi:UDP-2,4-diacetamido-2,4,6-trideoxy-beta-L-altropyranose hydrolase